MAQKTLTIEVPGSGSVMAVRAGPKGTVRWLFAYAPGAGSNVDDPFGVYAADALGASGVGDLPSLRVAVLFCAGRNDAFGSPEELRAAAKMVKRATVHMLEGADHGFAVRKSSGRSREDVWAEAVEAMVGWLGE